MIVSQARRHLASGLFFVRGITLLLTAGRWGSGVVGRWSGVMAW